MHSYIPVGILERVPQRINEKPPTSLDATNSRPCSPALTAQIDQNQVSPSPSSFFYSCHYLHFFRIFFVVFLVSFIIFFVVFLVSLLIFFVVFLFSFSYFLCSIPSFLAYFLHHGG